MDAIVSKSPEKVNALLRRRFDAYLKQHPDLKVGVPPKTGVPETPAGSREGQCRARFGTQ